MSRRSPLPRPPLTGLPLTDQLRLGVFSPDEALALLGTAPGHARLEQEHADALRLVTACGLLPLAVRIAAARLEARAGWTIKAPACRLTDEQRLLAELRVGDLTVDAVFEAGYRQLSPGRARAFRLLATVGGHTVDPACAAAVLAVDEATAESLLESLVDAALLEAPEPGHYRYHRLVRVFAAQRTPCQRCPTPPARRRPGYVALAGTSCPCGAHQAPGRVVALRCVTSVPDVRVGGSLGFGRMTDRVLELLRTRPDLAELAAFPFEFDVDRAYHVEEVHLASGASLEPIAGDDTGGTYFLCGGTAVLHASSEGDASLFADSVGEALEILVRLPAWCENISAELDEEGLLAEIRAADEEAREEFVPDLDARRAALISGLGLPDRPLVEILAMSESATRRTEPDFVLLNSHELCAYRLDEPFRQPLRDTVLGPGREALERMRSGDLGAWEEAAADLILRAGVLRAARYDRRDGDLPLLRFLLEHESAARTEWYEERRLAAVLVASYGQDRDVPLLRSATAGQVTDSAGAVQWARAEEAKRHGRHVTAESEFAWIDLAHRQGRLEHARVALIRTLDDTGPDADRLRELSRALERIGDHAQAARAQFNLLSLQDTARDRASEACVLARLERRKGDLAAAGRALERARAAVGADGTTPDGEVPQWHRLGLGRLITEQHLELTLAAVEAGDGELARTTMAHGRLLLDRIGKESAKALSRLSTRAKWAVAGLRPPAA
nr:hypothetical protein OH820_33310 [Streptomyces sp. NBC_00857]